MKVAIHQNKEIFSHSTSWVPAWIDYCEKNKIDYEVIDCYKNDIKSILKGFDILLWCTTNYSLQEKLFSKSILYSATQMNLKVFPNFNTIWHSDDKIAETYLLSSIDAPIPKSWIFVTKRSAEAFFEEDRQFPLVAKLKCGSGSTNVVLIKNKSEAKVYIKKMFGNGINSSPNPFFKAKSNIASANNLSTFISRLKRIPDFLESYRKASQFPNEKGYVYLQEFIPNDGYDLKVVVVGDKLSFLARNVRKNDFRASGGGTLIYDKSLITPEIRRISFDISKKLGFQCMGYDFVIDNRDKTPKIVEISYGFSYEAQIGLGGHWDNNDIWYEAPLNAPNEVLNNLVKNNRTKKGNN
ncbi:MAG: RimK family alpha-L-glutamate ligase [Vulcanibacillus sp.]